MGSNPLDHYPSETVIDQITKYHSEMIKEPDFGMPSALYHDDNYPFIGKPEQFQDNLFDEYLHDANNFNKNNQPPFLSPQTPQIMHHPSLPPVLPFSDLSLSQSMTSQFSHPINTINQHNSWPPINLNYGWPSTYPQFNKNGQFLYGTNKFTPKTTYRKMNHFVPRTSWRPINLPTSHLHNNFAHSPIHNNPPKLYSVQNNKAAINMIKDQRSTTPSFSISKKITILTTPSPIQLINNTDYSNKSDDKTKQNADSSNLLPHFIKNPNEPVILVNIPVLFSYKKDKSKIIPEESIESPKIKEILTKSQIYQRLNAQLASNQKVIDDIAKTDKETFLFHQRLPVEEEDYHDQQKKNQSKVDVNTKTEWSPIISNSTQTNQAYYDEVTKGYYFINNNYTFDEFDLPNTTHLSIPGDPEIDYPLFSPMTPSNFSCRKDQSGFFPDYELKCQVMINDEFSN